MGIKLIKSIEERLKATDPGILEIFTDADTLISAGFPALKDSQLSWINKSSTIIEGLTQYKNNYQYVLDETVLRIKTLEYKAYQDECNNNDNYKSWNEKSLAFYSNPQLVDFYRQTNYYRYIINTITEVINIIRYMGR